MVVKLTGQGTFVHRVDPDADRRWSPTPAWSCSARARCLWGSNFPVEKLWTDYASLMAGWQDALARHPEGVRRDVLSATAARVYRL